MAKLTAESIRKATDPGRLSDGGGLLLVVTKAGSKQWIQRIVIDGRRLDKGLGGFPTVTLTQARKLADSNRVAVADGRNPWATKERETASIRPEGRARRKTMAFEEVARLVHVEHSRQLSSDKNARNWIQTLERHIFPVIGDTPITEIGRGEVLAALKPIWWELPDAARRIKLRVRQVLDWAVENDLIAVNPERSLTKVSLPPQPKVLCHRLALPYQDVPAALVKVRESQAWDSTKLCFEWMVLTAARPGEARAVTWAEIQGDVWVIPAHKMKERQAHRVPLTGQALDLLRRARELHRTPADDPEWPLTLAPDAYLFPHPTSRQSLSTAALEDRVKKCGIPAVPHGFRSSFRDWAEEQEMVNASHNAIELCLAHTVGTAVERAYRRTDLLDQRRPLMQAWSNFVSPSESPF